ncbi:MAG: hypothetical protein IEMM0008_0913 [bacterium]|nr:MAG: hypothetical protein IEMM0008_0913 [bacterium]
MKTSILAFCLAGILGLGIPLQTTAYDSDELFGDWEIIQTKNHKTGKKYYPKSSLYAQFFDGGTLSITDMASRTRANWDWKLKGNKLILNSRIDNKWLVGKIRFLKKKKIMPGDKSAEPDYIRRFVFRFTSWAKRKVRGRWRTVKLGSYSWVFEYS